MSFELLERIFKHLESMNLLTHDSIVIDFMSGSGRTGTMAALRRYRTISVELEPHFIEMMAGYDCNGKSITDFRIEPCPCKSDVLHKLHKITGGICEVECSGNPRIVPVRRCGEKRHHKAHHVIGNKELLEQVTGRKVKWDILQGDARELSKLLHESGLAGVVSPPYADEKHSYKHGLKELGDNFKGRKAWEERIDTNPLNPDNISNLKDTPLTGVFSPPYFSQTAFQDKEFILSIAEDKSQRYRDGSIKGHFATPEAIQRYAEKIMENYSPDPRNIGNLPDTQLAGIFSPPYSQAQEGGGIAIKGYRGAHMHEQGKNQPDKVGQRCGYMKEVHGDDPANIGNFPDNNQQGESYLSAMLKVYRQSFLCGISPLVVVTKNPTRQNALRRLDLDTVWLLQNCHRDLFCQCDNPKA